MNTDRVVILTALDIEYSAVRARLANLRTEVHPAGTRFEVGNLGPRHGRVALAQVGKGNHPAAVLTERAISQFHPAAIFFVGVAGALREHIALGDVIVATHVYAYHGATSRDDGSMSRPRVWEVSHEADQTARHVARQADWMRPSPGDSDLAPAVHFGPIAAGEVVHDSTISYEAHWLRQHYNDALAIEMEAAGVAQAGHLNSARPVIVVRGISDRADGTKGETDGANWQERAAGNAAAFAVALADEFLIQVRRDGFADARGSGRSQRVPEFTNVARDNAQVGVQAGQIFGGVRIGADPQPSADLMVQLTSVRRGIQQAHRSGLIDQSTREAAEEELSVAVGALAGTEASKGGNLMVALKRLYGLISEVTELAAKVATIISAVRGMP